MTMFAAIYLLIGLGTALKDLLADWDIDAPLLGRGLWFFFLLLFWPLMVGAAIHRYIRL